MGDGNIFTFFITLKENGEAYRSLRNENGKWAYVNGEARITWNDGAQDVIRRMRRQRQEELHTWLVSRSQMSRITSRKRGNTSPRPI